MRIIPDYSKKLPEYWICEVNHSNLEKFKMFLKRKNLTFAIDETMTFHKKIWIVNNDSGKHPYLLSYFFNKDLLDNELVNRKRKMIYL